MRTTTRSPSISEEITSPWRKPRLTTGLGDHALRLIFAAWSVIISGCGQVAADYMLSVPVARYRPTHLRTACVFAVLAAICGGVAYDSAFESAFTSRSVWGDPGVVGCVAGAGCFALLAVFFAAQWKRDPKEAPPLVPALTPETARGAFAKDDLAAQHAEIAERMAAELVKAAQTPKPKSGRDT